VPLAEAQPEGDDLRVPYPKAQVKDAPHIDDEGELSEQEEAELYRYYGLRYSEAPSTAACRRVAETRAMRTTVTGTAVRFGTRTRSAVM
jgi:hypothetical protein